MFRPDNDHRPRTFAILAFTLMEALVAGCGSIASTPPGASSPRDAGADRFGTHDPSNNTGGSNNAGGSDNAGGSGGATNIPDASTGGASGDGASDAGPMPSKPRAIVPSTISMCTSPTEAGAFTFDHIGIWRDDATAAYVLIHDDMCGPELHGIENLAVPALTARGLTAGLGAIAGACEEAKMWDVVRDAEAQGHEILNHSYTHPLITSANANHEIVEAKALIDRNVKRPTTFFIFPYDYWDAGTLATVAKTGYTGARAGSNDLYDGFVKLPLNPASMPPATGEGSDMGTLFDVFPRSNSKYAAYYPDDVLDIHVWNAIDSWDNPPVDDTGPGAAVPTAKARTFAMREVHSVYPEGTRIDDGSQGFGPVPLSVYERHLDFLVAAWRSNKVWTAPPSAVLKYRHAQAACKASVSGSSLVFDVSNPDCKKNATPISVIIKSATDVPGLSAVQGGKPVSVRKLAARTFSVTADPTLGNVALGGCATASVAVEPDAISAFKKPVAAKSVCEIDHAKGDGASTVLDRLDRLDDDIENPNPSAADGRTGNWSWYPQNATVEIAKEATNSVLHFAGKNLARYAGATLGFMGGNGAGACYDASAYKGVRFKIKGRNTALEFDGKVIVSLVTAETQSRRYGGDHKGDGGHFFKAVPLTSDWQTVSLLWSDFTAPAFGTPPLPTAPAITKVQCLDFGMTPTSTDFEIFLDDLELIGATDGSSPSDGGSHDGGASPDAHVPRTDAGMSSPGKTEVKAGSVSATYLPWLRIAANTCPLMDAAHLAAQIEQESSWNPKAVSPIGAQGIAQFLPNTWAAFGVDANNDGKTDPFDPADAIVTQGKYMCYLASQFGTDLTWTTLLWAYNAGAVATKAAGGKAPTAEAANYATRIEHELLPKYRP